MSWIKDNQFIAVLGGVTLVGALALIFVGLNGRSRYNAAFDSYQNSAAAASGFERLPLYPTPTNRDGKRKALLDYREAVTDLQTTFGKFSPAELTNISPQEFTNHLKAANTEVRAAFEKSGATLPDGSFLGFESYTDVLAGEKSTGVLDYQLGAVRELMLALAKAAPTQLINLHRPRLAEERGEVWKAEPKEVARELPLEITFKGSEKSAREFLSSISKLDNYYVVLRTVRIGNEKATPPLAGDAKFDAPPAPAASNELFGGAGFVVPPDGEAAGAESAPAPAPVVDTGRVLSQVLGNEEVVVFLRLDILQFLPAKELPQP
jgi:hypothetical protein